jgi:hypothetical protein
MPTATQAADVGPIAVSPNGRHFVHPGGEPFFWLGDTQWELSRAFSLDDVRTIMQTRQQQGFSVLHVMLTGVGDGAAPNLAGHRPWLNDDPSTPDDRFFAHVDDVLELGRERGMVLAVGVFHQVQAERVTVANARAYAAWLARRYREVPNLIWAMYPKAEPESVPVIRELAQGLQDADEGRHLISVHPDPSPASSSFIHAEPWLSFNCIQTWAQTDLIGPMVTHDYQLQPTKPVAMVEGAYEAGSEYGFEVTPLWVRRQAYWTYLAGGHHSYGHNELWRLLPTWREALNAPGAVQLGILRQVLLDLRGWWNLVPAQGLIAGCEAGDPALNMAAHSGAGDWALVYLGGSATVSVRMAGIGASDTVAASWIAPTTGERTPAGSSPTTGLRRFSTPAGWEDALLLLEAE